MKIAFALAALITGTEPTPSVPAPNFVPEAAKKVTLTDLITDWNSLVGQIVEVTEGAIMDIEGTPRGVAGYYSDYILRVRIEVTSVPPHAKQILTHCRNGCKAVIRGLVVSDPNFGGKLVNIEPVYEYEEENP